MRPAQARLRLAALALALLAAVPAVVPLGGDSAECDPVCDSCHYAHDHVYHCYLDIEDFKVPATLDGAERKEVSVTLHLYGSVGLGYTTISRGWLELTSTGDFVAIEKYHQDYYSYPPGRRTFYWNVSGRLPGTDRLHVEVYGLGVHLAVVFRERADSGNITVTNPVNAAPRITITRPNGIDSPEADASYTIGIRTVDPNADHPLVDLYYDTDRDRENGQTLIVRGLLEPKTYAWDTRSMGEGWYYIHADADDQRGGKDSTTSQYPVIVTHGNHVPSVSLKTPMNRSLVYTPAADLTWVGTDADGDVLEYSVYVGRDVESLVLVGTTHDTHFSYRPPDNAHLVWTVVPRDAHVRGWCREGAWGFSTDIAYPVELSLILPADGSTMAGPSVKLVWYGVDLDYEQVLYDIYLDQVDASTRVARDWDDPAGPVYIASNLTPGAIYFWRIVGHNPFSPQGASATWQFRVADGGVPGGVLLGETVTKGSVRLWWGPKAGTPAAAVYDLHLVGPDDGDETVLASTTLTETVVEGLKEGASYRWYVVPRDAAGREGTCEPQYRDFNVTTNRRPSAAAVASVMDVAPGAATIRWTASDPDGDAILFDVYIDDSNATTLLEGSVGALEATVDLEPMRTYRWRAVPMDLYGPGAAAVGTIHVGPVGTAEPAAGNLVFPADGARVTGPLVVLEWNATDPHDRLVLAEIFISGTGVDPLTRPPAAVLVVGRTWSLGPLAEGATVRWAVRIHPEGGPSTVLGPATFTLAVKTASDPVALLVVRHGEGDGGGGGGGGGSGQGQSGGGATSVHCFKTVELDGNGSSSPVGSQLMYWFDFGDGNVTGWLAGSGASHAYMLPGTYNATLIVRDGEGRTSAPYVVRVEARPGDRTSTQGLPGPGAVAVPMALLLVAAVAAASRRHGARRGVR